MRNANMCDTINNGGNWNQFRIIQKMSEQHTWKVRHQVDKKTAILGTTNILRRVLT
jgi:cell division protein FtsI/penicillin-binding protein 2